MNQSRLIQPQQSRSQQTLDRILSSSVELIAEKSYADVTITQIAEHAQISVGGFYSRFANKDALFEALLAQLIDDTKQKISNALASQDEPKTLKDLLTLIVSDNARLYAQYRGVLITLHLNTRIVGSPEEARKIASYNDGLIADLEKLLLTKRSEINHQRPRLAIRTAITCISAMLKDAIVFRNLDQYPAPKNEKTVIRQVTNVVLGYLSCEVK